ncbi:MAG TPA: hypothetical protein VFW66_07170 [Gemmatimonadales bacterium]|nr:hypothetical protein [Gemmatimonadales bacterium]
MKSFWKVPVLLSALGIFACAPAKERTAHSVLAEGRTYTNWLYGSQYSKLWDRLTPEMRQVFGSAAELGAFAGRAVTRLGREEGKAEEQVAGRGPEQVYSRTASFTSSRKPVTIEWSLTPEGTVSGLVVRPADQ